MNEKIHLSLLQLENDLKELNAARKQVEDVVNAHNELKNTVSGYVSSLVSLQDSLNILLMEINDKNTIGINGFNKAIDTAKTKCDGVVKSFEEKVVSTSTAFKKSIDESIHSMDNELNKLDASIAANKELYKLFKESIETVEETKDALDKLLQELVSSQAKQDKNIDEIKNDLNRLILQDTKGFSDLSSVVNSSTEKIETTISSSVRKINQGIDTIGSTVIENGVNINQIQDVQNQQLSILTGVINSINNIATSVSELKANIQTTNDNLKKLSGSITNLSDKAKSGQEKQKFFNVVILIVVTLALVVSLVPLFTK